MKRLLRITRPGGDIEDHILDVAESESLAARAAQELALRRTGDWADWIEMDQVIRETRRVLIEGALMVGAALDGPTGDAHRQYGLELCRAARAKVDALRIPWEKLLGDA